MSFNKWNSLEYREVVPKIPGVAHLEFRICLRQLVTRLYLQVSEKRRKLNNATSARQDYTVHDIWITYES